MCQSRLTWYALGIRLGQMHNERDWAQATRRGLQKGHGVVHMLIYHNELVYHANSDARVTTSK